MWPFNATMKTVVELDLVAYSDIARVLEEHLDVYAVKAFQDQIQSFVNEGLALLGMRRNDVVYGTADDNAVLFFDDAATAHQFSAAVHHLCAEHNRRKELEAAKRWFRIGAATGAVLIVPDERRLIGTTAIRAVRLEAAARRGQLLIDRPTFDALPEHLRAIYGVEEVVSGKREERYRARRCTFIEERALPAAVVPGALTVREAVRVQVDFASLAPTGAPCWSIHVTNVWPHAEVELTHVWIETRPEIHVHNPDRQLPRRLRPQETFETWVPVDELLQTGIGGSALYQAARVRLATGEVVASAYDSRG